MLISVIHLILYLPMMYNYFCSCCLYHLPAAMQTYENQTWDNEKLQMVEQNVKQKLDAVEHKLTEVIKSIESQLGKHHPLLKMVKLGSHIILKSIKVYFKPTRVLLLPLIKLCV